MTPFTTKKLGDFCVTGSGSTPSRSEIDRYYKNGTIPWIKSGELRERTIQAAEEYVTDLALKETSVKLVPAGAILLAMYGATVGRLGILGLEATTNQAVCHIVPDSKIADTRYIYHALSAQVPKIIAMGVGGAQPNINQGMVKNLAIPLPGLTEQRRIAAILDQADALRTTQRETLAQLDSLAQAIFVEMFGDPSQNPKNWPKTYLGDLILKATDGPHVSPVYAETGIPFLSTRNVRAGEIVWDDLKYISPIDCQIHWKKCKPERNDILYTKGGTTGLAAVVNTDQPLAVWVHVALLKPNFEKVTSLWLESMLNSNYCYRQSQEFTHGIANRDLGLKRLIKISTYLPPLELQQKFDQRIQELIYVRSKLKAKSQQIEALFTSLQHRAFRGEL